MVVHGAGVAGLACLALALLYSMLYLCYERKQKLKQMLFRCFKSSFVLK